MTATSQENGASLRGPTMFTHIGRKVTMAQLAAETGLSIWTLYQRWHRGDRGKDLTRPKDPRGGWGQGRTA